MSNRRATSGARGEWLLGLAALLVGACHPHEPEGGVVLDTDVVEICPVVTAITALPLEVVVGAKLLVVAAMSPGTEDWGWTATAGHFDDPNEQRTFYHCDLPGEQVLTFTVSNGRECEDAVDVPVTCSYSPWCGNRRLDPGEQCDDGNARPDDGCSVRCFLEPLRANQ